MDLQKIYSILRDATAVFRKGDVIHGDAALVDAVNASIIEGRDAGMTNLPAGEVTFDFMPRVEDAPKHLRLVDVEFFVVGVDPEAAERNRAGFVEILKAYPQPDRLAAGPSYIEVGPLFGSQEAAFCVFALGEVLGLWKVMTPAKLGLTGKEAHDLARGGAIMITGYRPSKA